MENKYVLKGFFVLVFCLSNSVIANDVSKNVVELSFSDSYNLLRLGDIKKSYTFQEAEFFIFKQFETKYITINISPEECELIEIDGQHYLRVDNLPSFTKPGDPLLPVKSVVIKLPKNSEVMHISVISGNYKEILNEINIVPTPQPLKRIITNKNLSEENYKQIYNPETYNLNSYFPGKVFSYDIGNDNENKYILIRFYPIQYIPQEKKAMLITDAKIKVMYQITGDIPQAHSTSTKAVIITSQELKSQADALAAFHNNKGIPTEVITTQDIWNNYIAAPDPEYEGYKDLFLPRRDKIAKYNYTLAKKIISFLNRSSNIKYVILFGNARIVPPSYYMYIEENAGDYYDYYNRWIPTDYFYASPDYDLIPNYMVGRIPVNNTNEANHFIQKINNWSSNLNWSWFKNVAVAGGRPFLYPTQGSYDETFDGEVVSVDIINKGYFSGMNITKLFRTDNTFNKSSMKEVLSGNYGFVYHIDHGSGDNLTIDKEALSTSDIMALSPNSRVPIVVSVSCMNGAYDADLMPNDLYRYTQTMSIGESIIKSNAGGIVYIGGSRINYGGSQLYLKNGYVKSLKQEHMDEMSSNIFKAYHEGGDSIGNLTKSAILQYVIDNDFSENIVNKITLFGFVLLGDPALKIPIKQSEKYTPKPKLNVVNPQGERNSYFAYGDMPTYSFGSTVRVTCQANSSSVKMKLIAIDRLFNETIDVRNVNVVNNTATYTFTINDSHLYLVRCIDNNGKEGWLYVNQPYVVFTDSYSDQGEDIDDDGKFDYLTINVGVDVKKAGEYLIRGRLCDKIECIRVSSKLNLPLLGNQLIKLKFDGHEIYKLRMSGNYRLMYLKIYNKKGHLDYMPVEFRYSPYNTHNYHYSDFEHEVSKTAYISSSTYTDEDAGINTDNTDHFNYLITNITVYVNKAGFYNVVGLLIGFYTRGGVTYPYRITRALNRTYLNEGYQKVSLRFNGRFIYFMGDLYKGRTGGYEVRVGLLDSEGNDLFSYKSLLTRRSYNYTDFERLKDIFVSGHYSSSVIDTNNNGRSEYLTFTARLNIPSPGYYGIGADLVDHKDRTIDSAFVEKYLTSGMHTIQLNFSGWKIHSHGVDGPYRVVDLRVVDITGMLDYEINPHNTSFYRYTSFESVPWKILLVDDDDGKYYEEDYKDALDANEYTYKYWNVRDRGSPTFHDLSSYDVVIWFTGDDFTETLTSTDRSNLQRYLDAGGKLFISGQCIGYEIGHTSFYQNYLHATYIADNKNTSEIKGIYGDYISDGLNINQYGRSPDVISVRGDAVKIFDYVGGLYPAYPAAGLRYDGKYRLVYLPFGFEFASKQYTLMDRIIKWLLQPTTFKNYIDYGEDTDGDGLYNYLVISVTLNVSRAGNFTISGKLYDPDLRYVDDYETKRYLNAGMQTVQLKFDGHKIYNNNASGRYKLKFLTIENVDSANEYPVDYAIDPYTTSYYLYTAFDRAFTGNYEESTENIYEEEGVRYRYLTINVTVNITSAGSYIVSGELYDRNLLFVTKASNFTYLNSGIQTVKLNFKGSHIYRAETNGRYYLKNLLIKNLGETIDYRWIAYMTSPYNYSYFKVGDVPTTVVHGVNNTNIANATVPAGHLGRINFTVCNNGTADNVLYIFNASMLLCPGFSINSTPPPIILNASRCANVTVIMNTPTDVAQTCNISLNASNLTYGVSAIATGHVTTTIVIYGVNNTNIANATVIAGQTGNITYRICNNGTVNNVVYNFMNETGCPGFNITLPSPITLNASQCREVKISVSTPINLSQVCDVLLNASNSTHNVQATAMGHITTTLQPTGKATDIFEAIEILEYLSGEKNLARGMDYYDLNDDKTVNLLDVFILIDKILT